MNGWNLTKICICIDIDKAKVGIVMHWSAPICNQSYRIVKHWSAPICNQSYSGLLMSEIHLILFPLNILRMN